MDGWRAQRSRLRLLEKSSPSRAQRAPRPIESLPTSRCWQLRRYSQARRSSSVRRATHLRAAASPAQNHRVAAQPDPLAKMQCDALPIARSSLGGEASVCGAEQASHCRLLRAAIGAKCGIRGALAARRESGAPHDDKLQTGRLHSPIYQQRYVQSAAARIRRRSSSSRALMQGRGARRRA